MPLRVPTPEIVALRWHSAQMEMFARLGRDSATLGNRDLRDLVDASGEPWSLPEEPQCGWYQRRLKRDGPWVAARVYLHQPIDPETGELWDDEVLRCQIDGKDRDPYEEWIGIGIRPIPHSRFRYLCTLADWVCEYAPDEPQAQPEKKMNFLTVAPPTFERKKR